MAGVKVGLEFLAEKDKMLRASGEVMLVDAEDIEDDLVSEDTRSSEEEEYEELGMEMEHPLTNSIVANIILSYLTLEDLKACRLVCRSWSDESRVHQSRMIKVVLHSEERLKGYIYEFIGDRTFFDTIQLGPYMYMGNPTADRFFQLYGVYVKHLILHKTQCSGAHLRDILFRWAPNLEQLTLTGQTPGKARLVEYLHAYERLKLHKLRVMHLNLMLTQGEGLLRDFLYDLFSVSPNLEKIIVPKASYKGFLPCLIATLLESPDLPLDNLTQIDTLFSFSDAQIEQLTGRGFPLECLNLQLMPNVNIEVLLALLDGLSDTLKTLRLYFYLTRFKELPARLVRLEKLQDLTLDTYQGSLKFVHSLPELQVLSVAMKCLKELENAFPKTHHGPGFWCCPTLKSFNARLSVVEGCPSGLIAGFESIFPGLRSITLPGITDIALKLICSTFPKLEELNAPQGVYTDMGITGIAEGKLRFLSRGINLNNVESIRNSCPALYSGNIAGLTKLQKLHLQSPDLTDDSIFYSILHMHDLKELTIERSDITDKGIDAIINHMNLQRLNISLCTRVSGPQLELVKAKLKNRNLVLNFDGKRYSMYD